MSDGPDAYILPHDRLLVSTDATVAPKPTQAGPYGGRPIPQTANEGSLLPFHDGDEWDTTSGSQTTPVGIRYRLQRTGNMYGKAEWAWRFDTDANTQWRGMNALQFQHSPHNPFSTQKTAEGCTVIYSKAFNRVLICRYNPDVSTGIRFEFSYRSASKADPTTYDGTYYLPASDGFIGQGLAPGRILSSFCEYVVWWECPDGALRFGYCFEKAAAPLLTDFVLWGSADGGATWDMVNDNIFWDAFSTRPQVVNIRAACSGDWVRLDCFTLNTPSLTAGVLTLVSADRGATFKLLSTSPTVQGTFGSLDSVMKYETQNLVGLGDAEGTFLRVLKPHGGTYMRWETASRDDNWAELAGTTTSQFNAVNAAANIQAVYATATDANIALIMGHDDGSGDNGYQGFLIPKNRLFTGVFSDATQDLRSNEWTLFSKNDANGYAGAVVYSPKNSTMQWVGDSIIQFGGLIDRPTSTSALIAYSSASIWGGWSRKPITIPTGLRNGLNGSFFMDQWIAPIGLPAASGTTPWTETLSGGATKTWSVDYTEIAGAAGAPAKRVFWSKATAAAGVTQHLADDGVIEFVGQAVITTSTGGFSVSSAAKAVPTFGVTCKGYSSDVAGNTISLALHLTDDGIALYDVAAGTTIYSNATVDIKEWHRYRISLSSAQRCNQSGTGFYAELSFMEGFGDGAWTNSGLLALNSATVTPAGQSVQWGAITTGRGWKYRIKQFGYNNMNLSGNVPGYTNPTDVRGAMPSPFPVRVAQDIHARWGGGGGFMNDEFLANPEHQHGLDKLANPSPSMYWKSRVATAETIIFDAATLNGSTAQVDMFKHNAIALFGTNFRKCFVDYAAATSFASPSTALLTLDATVGSFYVSSATTSCVIVSAGTSGILKDNEFDGWFLQYEAPAADTDSDKKVYTLYKSNGTTLTIAGLTQAASSTFAAGGTLHLFPNKHVLRYETHAPALNAGIENRYMRISLNVDYGPLEEDGAWKIGRVVAGMTLPFSVPMDWAHSEVSQGNVVLSQSMNGTRMGYKAGDARRGLQAKVQGDIDRWRTAFGETVKNVSNFNQHPMVVVIDDDHDVFSSMYCRYTDNIAFSNAGWRYDATNSRWEKVGDITVEFEEEL